MTLRHFEKLLKKVSPKLMLRYRNYGDIVGLFAGKSGKTGYILRMTKGEFNLAGYRAAVYNQTDLFAPPLNGNIKKRGRKTVINILRNYRWIKSHRQTSMLLGNRRVI